MKSFFFYRFDQFGKHWTGEHIDNITIGIAEEDDAITELFFEYHIPANFTKAKRQELETPLIKETAIQVEDYLAGKRKDFSLPLALHGTDFQVAAWQGLQTIPYGETRSYKDMAELIGRPKAVRAVGLANNRNPISIIVPCHRVIGHNGTLVGYGGGLPLKRYLLDLEQGRLG
ncbi:MAG: methylated-DNA--[protein]-cysteine S-methyltransferase [Treponema sp.]|nr:methylated-DNA--[protein]-cysteine S-methyltransferase [Treponema sp.]